MHRHTSEYTELRIAGHAKRVHSTAGDLTCLCREALAVELRSIYDTNSWVYDALMGREDARVLRGRMPVVTGELSGVAAVVKRFHHGGATASLWRDRFLSSTRFRNHIVVSRYLAEHGVATPDVLFVSWRRIFGTFRGEVGLEHVEGIDADQWFFRTGVVPADWQDQARRIGALVARLHRIGFLHRDMNLMNFYFADDGRMLILDLDKSSVETTMSGSEKTRTLARLERSIRKQGRGRAPDYVGGVVRELREGYAEANA